MDLHQVIARINEEEDVPPHKHERSQYHGQVVKRVDTEWEELLSSLKGLDRQSIGQHFCQWSTPNTLSFGNQTVSLDYPITDKETEFPRVLFRFSRSLEPRPPILAMWGSPTSDVMGRFVWKVSGVGIELQLLGTSGLAGLIIERLHSAETALLASMAATV